jgi:hypothetical protein
LHGVLDYELNLVNKQNILKWEGGKNKNRIVFEDEYLQVYPIKIEGFKDECYSYVCVPKM